LHDALPILEQAEEIADIAMTNMPVEHYGYYTLLEPYISAYYEVGAKDKARKLFKDVAKKYQENLAYYAGLSENEQMKTIEEIVSDMERYRGIVDVVVEYDDELGEKEQLTFNNYIKLFSRLGGSEMEEPDDDITDILPEVDTTMLPEEDSLVPPLD